MTGTGQGKVLIICGGRGSRMGELTENLPKPLVEIQSKPLLHHIIENYRMRGFNDFVFAIGYRGDLIRESIAGMEIRAEFSDAGVEAGILCRIHTALELLPENFIISYGDTFAALDFVQLYKHHVASNKKATIVIAAIQNPFGIIDIDEYGLVRAFHEKPILNHYIGYMVMSKAAFGSIPDSLIGNRDGEGLVLAFQALSTAGELGSFKHDGLQVTINTPEEYLRAQKTLGEYFTA